MKKKSKIRIQEARYKALKKFLKKMRQSISSKNLSYFRKSSLLSWNKTEKIIQVELQSQCTLKRFSIRNEIKRKMVLV